jgi:hypothetical protein
MGREDGWGASGREEGDGVTGEGGGDWLEGRQSTGDGRKYGWS